MIEAIRNQPINFKEILEAELCKDCGNRKPQCSVLDSGKDWFSFQFKNPPTNRLDSTGFCDDGTLLVSNTFDAAGSALVTVANLTWDSVDEKYCVDSSGGPITLNLNTNPFVSGGYYRIRVLCSGFDPAQAIRFITGTSSIVSDYYYGNGWADFTFYSDGNNINVDFGSVLDGCIEQMEVYQLGSSLTIGEGWNIIDSDTPDGCGIKFCHTAGGSYTDPISSSYPLVIGKRYKFLIRITGATAGAVTFNAGSYSESLSSNGYYTRWIDNTISGVPNFVPTDDFDGCFEFIEFGDQPTKHGIILEDSDGNFVKDLTNYGLAYQDNYFLSVALSILTPAIADGCYQICVYDYTTVYGQAADQAQGAMEFIDDTGWTLVDGISMNTSTGLLLVKDGGTAQVDLSGILTLANGSCYIMEIKFRNYDTTNALADQFTISLGGTVIFSNPAIDSSNAGIFQVPFTWSGSFNGLVDFYSEAGVDNDLEIDYVRIFIDQSCSGFTAEPTFCSQCLHILADTGCSKQVWGYMEPIKDANGVVQYKSAYGFLWHYFFRPLIRANVEFHNSLYPMDTDSYLDNAGTYRTTGGILEKKWDFAMRSLTEDEHDALRLIVKCDWIKIYEDSLNSDPTLKRGDTYFCPAKELAPAWPKKDKTITADVEFEIMRKNNEALFNNNTK